MAVRELGSNALQVVSAVREAVGRERPVHVACSGGSDSLALAGAAIHAGVAAGVLVVDHGLQPGSDRVAERVREQLDSWQSDRFPDRRLVPTEVLAVTVAQGGAGPEAEARRARYRVLDSVLARRGGIVLLGHTMDDQAETMLLRLTRGSGARSLAGMRPRRGNYLRPMLGLRRAVPRTACGEFGLTPWQDPHNDDPRFVRTRVRHRVLPVLEAELGPGVVEALARSGDQLAEDEAYFGTQLAGMGRVADQLPVSVLAMQPTAVRRRAIRDWLVARGARDLGRVHVLAVDRLVTDWRGQKQVEVPGLRVARSAGVLRTVEE